MPRPRPASRRSTGRADDVRRSDFVIENNDTVDSLCLKLAEVMTRIETGERPRLYRQSESAGPESRH